MAGHRRTGGQTHWEDRYDGTRPEELSWFEARPDLSLDLITERVGPDAGVIDIGGGASRLADCLLARGYVDVSVLDISTTALAKAQERMGGQAAQVAWIAADITAWTPPRRYDLWHDRAVFHFLTDAGGQRAYLAAMAEALRPGGHAIVMSFAEDGPESCSGLPVRRYAPEEMAETLADLVPGAFRPDGAGRFTHVTPTGAEQRFQYSLFRREPSG
ncbi:class I SAM-dependent methyltransferase [Alterinioella nitratireducens]|uniref:class I SAM-dependent methyltransferase n=1 Tax=Alterinioella nitratireducens TaxID=2735915 RepID=UPI0015523640|nr:class I SAM-dependent methyltransferase [Alterinioella nitratireducens]NPD20031.1 class I SAM-dependent methyltransferase [Alterinioella nitratireducens]